MNALILGGSSPRHKAWVRDLAAALAPHFSTVRYLDYRHWDIPEGAADLQHEIRAAGQLAAPLGEYVIIAKSIGTVITTLGCAGELLHPKRCILLGFPLAIIQDEFPDFEVALQRLPPSHLVQNAHDPLGSFAEVAAYIERQRPLQVTLLETPGGTHDYSDFDLIARLSGAAKQLPSR